MEAVRKTIQDVLSAKLKPNVERTEKENSFCFEAQRELGKLELLAPVLPEPYGVGDVHLQTILAEEMGYVCCGFGCSSLASTILFGANIGRHGTPEQKEKYLPGIARGEKMGCWALTEPQVGSDALSVKTTCRPDGDHYVISGSKTFITNGPIADYFVVITRESGDGIEGGTAVILEKGMTGLSVGKPLEKMGNKSSPMSEVFIDGVRVHRSQILGKPGKGFFDMKNSLDVERIVYSALAVGMMRFCLDASIAYGGQRHQFGKPILHFQMVQEKVARMAAAYEVCSTYLYKAVDMMMNGENVNKQAAILKYVTAEKSNMVANEAIQIHGGYGYMTEYQVERVLRDTKALEIGAGTSEIQKLIIAKQAIKERS
jgi:alkylation response protein AidB-like acyl-CoA dehydrogenase